jgi:drug/metabolite transporter (DMT)-like permease
VQLAVPVITALGAVGLLGERPTPRLAIGAAAILGGVALSLRRSPTGGRTGPDELSLVRDLPAPPAR